MGAQSSSVNHDAGANFLTCDLFGKRERVHHHLRNCIMRKQNFYPFENFGKFNFQSSRVLIVVACFRNNLIFKRVLRMRY